MNIKKIAQVAGLVSRRDSRMKFVQKGRKMHIYPQNGMEFRQVHLYRVLRSCMFQGRQPFQRSWPFPDQYPIDLKNGLVSSGTVTPNQLKAIYVLARRNRLDPQKLVHDQFDRYVPEDLAMREASELLDELKQDRSVARPTAWFDQACGM